MIRNLKLKKLPSFYTDSSICVMGLGYVGLTLAVTLADIGFKVYGVEIKDDILNKLNKGVPHFFEPGLEGRLKSVKKSQNLKIYKEIPENCDSTIFIITVGTPIDENNKIKKEMIENVSKEISLHLKDKDLVILRSTVEVGTTAYLDERIFRKTGKSYEIAFCPERTIEGKAMVELRQLPQIIGSESINTSSRVSQFFSFMTPTIVRVSSKETAELIKLIDNSQRDVSFALSNEIAEISDAYSISAYEVISSGKLGYPRTNLPLPGPVGGPCLEKDSYILKNGLKKKNYVPKIIMSSRNINEMQPKKSISLLHKVSKKFFNKNGLRITLAGLAFKGEPETNDLRGTMAKPIYSEIIKRFSKSQVMFYDPLVKAKEIQEYFSIKNCVFTDNLKDSFQNCHIYIICNNHQMFNVISISSLSEKMCKPGIIFDYWNNFTNQNINYPNSIYYVGLGGLGKLIKELN